MHDAGAGTSQFQESADGQIMTEDSRYVGRFRKMPPWLLFFLLCFLIVAAVEADIYKWVDDKGVINYSESPPPGRKSERVETAPSPSKEAIEEAQERLQRRVQEQRMREQTRQSEADNRSLPLSALGPLPQNVSSEYLETKSTGISMDFEKKVAQVSIALVSKAGLPSGAYLEVNFENPADPAAPIVVKRSRQGGEQEMFIVSPEFKGLKCRNYQVMVHVFRDGSKSELLGVHRQIIQSRVNLDRIGSPKDLIQAGSQGICP